MTYAVRNTLVLAGFWIVIFAAGFSYVFGHQKSAIADLRQEHFSKRQRLQDLLNLEIDRSSLQQQLTRLEDFRLGKMGTLAAHESPGETFDYLLRELNRTRSGLEVNFVLKSQDSYLAMARRTYVITGSGAFDDFYRLLWFMESGPLFYDIHQLELESIPGPDGRKRSQQVRFTITFNGYNRTEGPAITGMNAEKQTPPQIASLVNGTSRFEGSRIPQSLIAVEQRQLQLPKPVAVRQNTEGLPEVGGRTQVLAIMPGAAVLKDQSGRMVRLKPGDRVFGGSLSEINTKEGTVQFSLQDESGGSTTLVLPAGSK